MTTGNEFDNWTLESLLTLKEEIPTLRNRLKEANSQQERLLSMIRKQEVLIDDQHKIIEGLGDTISAERANKVSEMEELKNLLGALQEQVDLRNGEDKVPAEEQAPTTASGAADSDPDAKLKHLLNSLLGTELKEKHKKIQTLEGEAQLLKMKLEELTKHCFEQCGLVNQQQHQIEKLKEELTNLFSEGLDERECLLRRIRDLENAVDFLNSTPTNGKPDPRPPLQITTKQKPDEAEGAPRDDIAMQIVGPDKEPAGSANAEPPFSATYDNRRMRPGRVKVLGPWRLIPLRL